MQAIEQRDSKNYEKYFETALRNVKEYDSDFVIKFDRKMELQGIGILRRLRYVYFFSHLSRVIKKPIENINRNDIETYFIYLKNTNKLSNATKNTHWFMFKKILTFHNHKLNLSYYKIKFREKKLTTGDILTVDEANNIISYSDSFKYRVLFSILYESGCRIGELLNLKVSDVTFDKKGCILSVDGKTGQRDIRISKVAELLRKYIEEYKPKQFIFNISKKTISEHLKQSATRAGVHKRIYPHLFRHSRATQLAKAGLSEQQLKVFFGWAGASKMAETYVHLTGRDIDDKIIQVNNEQETNISQQQTQSQSVSVNQNIQIQQQPQDNTLSFVMPAEFMQFMSEMFVKWKERKQLKPIE